MCPEEMGPSVRQSTCQPATVLPASSLSSHFSFLLNPSSSSRRSSSSSLRLEPYQHVAPTHTFYVPNTAPRHCSDPAAHSILTCPTPSAADPQAHLIRSSAPSFHGTRISHSDRSLDMETKGHQGKFEAWEQKRSWHGHARHPSKEEEDQEGQQSKNSSISFIERTVLISMSDCWHPLDA